MDTLTNKGLFALYEIANTIGTPRSYDWYILIISFFSVIVSAILVWRVGRGQIKAQRDAIKMQLFDKRYATYKCILECQKIFGDFDRENDYISGDEETININGKIIELRKEITVHADLADLLFDDINLCSQIHSIRKKYYDVVQYHFEVQKLMIKHISDKQDFFNLFSKIMLATTAEEKVILEKEMNYKYGEIGNKLIESNIRNRNFSNYIDSSGIYESISKYLNISNIDKN